jgi:hypothetical protein
MPPNYREFDLTRLRLLPLAERVHDLDLSVLRELAPRAPRPQLAEAGAAIARARADKASVIFMMGAHVIRSGLQRYLIDLMRRGVITCLSLNGACVIHDFELAMIGKTTESVARYIARGQFGLWRETGRINDIVARGARQGQGLGECVGAYVAGSDFPHKDISLLAAAWELGVPATVHVGIGADIIHEHPNCDGAAFGAASHRDFLRFAAELDHVDHGFVANFGSAVTAPEVFLKALAMVRNGRFHEGRSMAGFTTLVTDLVPLPGNPQDHAPEKSDARYYFRPWKTMLVRCVADGRGMYVQGRHEETIPELWTAVRDAGQG